MSPVLIFVMTSGVIGPMSLQPMSGVFYVLLLSSTDSLTGGVVGFLCCSVTPVGQNSDFLCCPHSAHRVDCAAFVFVL